MKKLETEYTNTKRFISRQTKNALSFTELGYTNLSVSIRNKTVNFCIASIKKYVCTGGLNTSCYMKVPTQSGYYGFET